MMTREEAIAEATRRVKGGWVVEGYSDEEAIQVLAQARLDLEAIEHSLTNHKPANDMVVSDIEDLRRQAVELAVEIIGSTPRSRERSLAITKLEEAVMWGVKAIVLNGTTP